MRYGFGNRRGSAGLRLRTTIGAVFTIAVLTSSGCGSESVAAKANPVDLSKLNVGSYSSRPQDRVFKDPARTARTMEALRLGNIMPLPQEVDPSLRYHSSFTHPFVDVESFAGDPVFGYFNITDFTANTPGLVAGFSTSGQSNADSAIATELTDAVMIFDTADAAGSAATALARSGFDNRFGSNDSAEPAQSTQYPTAHLSWIPKNQELASWYATGQFVIITLVGDQANNALKVSDQASLRALSDKAITVTADRLKSFQPTLPDKLASLPTDPQGMLRLTLPVPTGDDTAYPFDGTLDRHGALHKVDDPDKAPARFEKSGVDFVSYGAGRLVRTRDAAAAQTYVDEISIDRFQQRIDPPPGLPTARCSRYYERRPFASNFHCYVAYQRYAIEIWSDQQQDLYQRISAQYAILANSK